MSLLEQALDHGSIGLLIDRFNIAYYGPAEFNSRIDIAKIAKKVEGGDDRVLPKDLS